MGVRRGAYVEYVYARSVSDTAQAEDGCLQTLWGSCRCSDARAKVR